MTKLDAIAPILWAKWDTTLLDALREESLEAADGLAFRATNSEAGGHTLLVVCTINRAQIAMRPESVRTLEKLLDLPA